MTGYRTIGLIGATNLSILALITEPNIRKRLVLHLFLLGATTFSIPMYISFIVINDYGVITYSFHKLEPAFLIGAFSITINDWSSVLYDIREIRREPLILRKFSLIVINVIFFSSSIINFFFCILSNSLKSFLNSPIYIVMIFMQLSVEILLTSMMLHSGLRLSRRIHGVFGLISSTRPPMPSARTSVDTANGFESALNRLISVMGVCTLCILCQSVLLLLNYTLGYEKDPGKTVGPPLFFWTFYSWLPLWGPVLSLLHLSRSRNLGQKIDIRTVNSKPNILSGRDSVDSGSSEGQMYTVSLLDPGSREAGYSAATSGGDSKLNKSQTESGSHQSYHSHQSQRSHQSQQSHHSHRSSAGKPGEGSEHSIISVYRPPDYPSSLFLNKGNDADSVHSAGDVLDVYSNHSRSNSVTSSINSVSIAVSFSTPTRPIPTGQELSSSSSTLAPSRGGEDVANLLVRLTASGQKNGNQSTDISVQSADPKLAGSMSSKGSSNTNAGGLLIASNEQPQSYQHSFTESTMPQTSLFYRLSSIGSVEGMDEQFDDMP